MKNSLLIILVLLFSSSSLANTDKEILFLASEKELTKVKNTDDLDGIAISIKFYTNSSTDIQKRIDALVGHLISLKFRPVFLYGQPFDQELAKRLLIVDGKFEDGSGCKPTAWAGILPKDNDVGKMCGADDNPRSEEKFREWITEYWKYAKKFFLGDK